jgi:hypothetical protein
MKLERISAIVQTRPAQARAESRVPANGESLLLTCAEPIGPDLLAITSDGLALRLAGLARWQRDLQPGDLLRMRVLANEPLELALESSPLRGAMLGADDADLGTHVMTQHTAMRLDQALLRQMSWQMPNAAALALSWRHLAQERWYGGAFAQQGTGERGSAAPATMLGAAPFRELPTTLPPPNLDRSLISVYAWGGAQLLLGLQESDADGQAQHSDRRRQFVLRLELAPLALGHIVLQAQWLPGGLQLLIAIEQIEAVPLVRAALTAIRAALNRAGLPLVRLRLTQGLAAVTTLRDVPTPASHVYFVSQQSSLLLFRTLAEAAVVLLQIVPESV